MIPRCGRAGSAICTTALQRPRSHGAGGTVLVGSTIMSSLQLWVSPSNRRVMRRLGSVLLLPICLLKGLT